jgi:hypothetical protein
VWLHQEFLASTSRYIGCFLWWAHGLKEAESKRMAVLAFQDWAFVATAADCREVFNNADSLLSSAREPYVCASVLFSKMRAPSCSSACRGSATSRGAKCRTCSSHCFLLVLCVLQ